MSKLWALVLVILFSISISFSIISISCAENTQKTFIVRVRNDLKPAEFSDSEEWYSSTLRSLDSYSSNNYSYQRTRQRDFIHVYRTVFHGFSASLTTEQAGELAKRPEVLGLIPDQLRQIQTTRSPQFLGLAANNPTGLLTDSNSASNVIIGVLDTGISPERRSFHDESLGPIPPRWKGVCTEGEKFTKQMCNNKIIGARYFADGYEASVGDMAGPADIKSPRDSDGHGTHTASTAAGRAVANASLFGFALGVAAGIAPKARVGVYKICWSRGCMDTDILAAFDKAVEDGVDVISLSVGGGGGVPYSMDPIALGTFGAMERGVFVSAAAGNGGPSIMSVTNIAPWMTTVGASTIDRKFPVNLLLEDGTVITGSSLYNGKPLPRNTYLPLIYAGNASKDNSTGGSSSMAAMCVPGTLDNKLVRGKIVVCDRGGVSRVSKGQTVKDSGGVGVIVENVMTEGEGLVADPHLIPAVAITVSAGIKVRAYINSSQKPRATMIFRGTQVGVKPAPVVASFSARGPSSESVYLLKPDVVAPGVNILAAWPDSVAPSGLSSDTRRTEFNIVSGTSMSCPHVSGVAALLKGAHPDWSPAMIRSALMTTAYTRDLGGKPLLDETNYREANVWATGAGHVAPQKAVDPGLVYDLGTGDYLDFLCASNYSEADISRITHNKQVSCKGKQHKPWDLNYPSISVAFDMSSSSPRKSMTPFDVAVTRTATNVGTVGSSYSVSVTPPPGTKVTITPPKMVFKTKGQKQSYVVRISAAEKPTGDVYTVSGELRWTDGEHQVISPLVVTWENPI